MDQSNGNAAAPTGASKTLLISHQSSIRPPAHTHICNPHSMSTSRSDAGVVRTSSLAPRLAADSRACLVTAQAVVEYDVHR